MSTYKLDETPDTYLSGVIKEGSYIFRMNHIEEESNNKYLREIDLRKDKLIVYGTEINVSNREKLHSSLIFRPDVGKLCVNCNGACYIYINKLSVELKKNVKPEDMKLNLSLSGDLKFFSGPFKTKLYPFMISCNDISSASVNAACASKLFTEGKPAAPLKPKSSSHTPPQSPKAMPNNASSPAEGPIAEEPTADDEPTLNLPNTVADLLKKQQQQKEAELAANKQEIEELKKDKKIEIDSYKEEVNDLRNQVLSSKKDNKYLEVELQMVQRQLSSTVFELLETSKILERVAKLEEQQGKVRSIEDRFSLIEKELQSTKFEQESTKKSVEGLDSLISSCRKENEDLFAKLQKVKNQSSTNKYITCEKVQDHINVIMNELQSIKNFMGFAAEMEVELEN